MDNILDKLGLYDFFGLLLPGMFFIVVLDLIDFPLINLFTYPESEVFNVVVFALVSYICGTIMQEIASYIDNEKKKIRENIIKDVLKDKKFSESERKKIEKIVKDLSKESSSIEDKCYGAFFICKEYLENEEKMKKADKLDAIYAMSRDFALCNFLLSICVVITMAEHNTSTFYDWLFLFSLITSIFVFYYRAKRYAKMRVRSIFRRYMICKDSKEKNFLERIYYGT